MVARIDIVKNISKLLSYHEKKRQHGKAVCLFESGFLKELQQLTYHDKWMTFQKRISLNERARCNTLHISLNFHPSEKLKDACLIAIAESYMEKIGFGQQPYLVYRHDDSGHPHFHIVSTNIKNDGSCIATYKIGFRISEPARKQIEIDFDLVKADSHRPLETWDHKPGLPQKMLYGSRPTKQGISDILCAIIFKYKYTSLPELNTVLKLYNIRADRCGGANTSYDQDGLLYKVLDDQGKPIGVPIKASLFVMKPTLNNLRIRMWENELLKPIHVNRIKEQIDLVLWKQCHPSQEAFIADLNRENISTVIAYNPAGLVQGVSFVDHHTKCVFTDLELGKYYFAERIFDRSKGLALKNSTLQANSEMNLLSAKTDRKDSWDRHLPTVEKGRFGIRMVPALHTGNEPLAHLMKRGKERSAS